MKSKLLAQTGCGALAYAVAVFGLPQSAGHKMDRLRPRHSASASGSATRTVMVTVSLALRLLLHSEAPIVPTLAQMKHNNIDYRNSCDRIPFGRSPLPLRCFREPPSRLRLFLDHHYQFGATHYLFHVFIHPTYTTDPNFNPITAPAIGGGNAILAQNAAQAQALNRKFRELTFSDSCLDGDEACIGDGPSLCILGIWRRQLCRQPNTRCRAVPRMQTNGTAIGCYTEADLEARFSSTGRSGSAFGE
ncbi:carbohydrate-binding module family 19 protein [Rhizoctonia solani]|uniref:Carbohydrate-binding module family 19 protein n=1 Tax=Rhizoctonia solani TaxID=456999 RepID=A0A8H8P0B5_9AGAM|nr:carbohydrate-binding module family 19 protein [Rhizoctonia solani]QRW22745.1 carbohydrate-binding module family 19 protein [Rhizoctonia solani]